MGNKIKLYNCDQKHLNTKDTLYLDYLSLIGIKKIEQPNLNFLTKIHQAHIETIGYTNLDFIFGREISLKLEDIIFKLINEHPGGVCYELTYAFYHLLKFLGFDIRLVYANLPRDKNTIFKHSETSHVIGLVNLDKTIYMTDICFSSRSRRQPIDIYKSAYEEQRGEYRIVQTKLNNIDKFILQKKRNGNYINCYSFKLDHHFIPPETMSYKKCPQEIYPNLYGDFEYMLPTSNSYRQIINNIFTESSSGNKTTIVINNYEQFITILVKKMNANKNFLNNLSKEVFTSILSSPLK